MKKSWKSILALLLGASMVFTSPTNVIAIKENNNMADEQVEISKETASDLVTSIFGNTLDEGEKTDEGYQYRVPIEAFSGITDGIEKMKKENVQDINNSYELEEEEQNSTSEKGNELPENYVDNSNDDLYKLLEKAKEIDEEIEKASTSSRKVDVVFVIDSTGSMSSSIRAVKNNVAEFSKYLSEQSISLRLGLIEYRDVKNDGIDSTVVHSANHSNWMNVSQFINELTEVVADGGGDSPETPIDALGHLTEGTMLWNSDAYKFAVLITDASYKVDNNHGISDMDDMIKRLQEKDIQVSTITSSYNSKTYGNLAGMTGGIQGDLYGNFSEILQDYADSIVGGARPTQDYSIRISEETTGLPISGATISWSGGSASVTDKNGMTVITTRNNPIRSVSISCTGYHTVEIDKLELLNSSCVNISMAVNEDEVIKTEDGIPVLTPSMFQSPKSGSDTAQAPYVELLGKKFNLFDSLSLSFDFEPFGKKVNISHNGEEKKFEVIIGKDFKGKNEDNRGYWEDSYQQYKTLVQKFSKKSAKEIYNDFRSLRKSAKSKEDFLFPIDAYVGGYAEASYASGTLDVLEGGIVVGASLSNDQEIFKFRIPPAPYIFFKLTFNVDAKANVGIVTVIPGKKFGVSDATIEVTPNLKGTINLGVERLATVGGGLQGDLATKIKMPFKSFSEGVSADLKGKFIFYLKLLGFSFDADIPLKDVSIYPASKTKNLMLLQAEKENFELIKRPKAGKVKTYNALSEFVYQKTNTYSDNTPQLLQLRDGRWLMVWTDAVPKRKDVNMTALYYTISTDGKNWSEPEMVFDDYTSDFMPSLALSGNGTPILAWQNSNKTYKGTDLTLEERAKDIEISVATFDISKEVFNTPVTLTSDKNENCELAIQVVPQKEGAAIYWLENSENDLLLDSGKSRIRTSSLNLEDNTWSEPETIIENLKKINNFSAGEILGQSYVAYSIQGEKVIRYYNQKEDLLKSITSDTAISGLKIDEGLLYWSDNAGFYSWDGANVTTESEYLAGSNFDIVQEDSTRMAILSCSDGITNELWTSINRGYGWCKPVPLTDYKMSLSAVSPTLKDNKLYWAVGRTAVDEKTDSFGTTDLIVDNTNFSSDITVDEHVYVSELDDIKDGKLDILIDITNKGLAEEGKLKAVFYSNNSEVGESELFVVDEEDITKKPVNMTKISSGEHLLTLAQYQLPSVQKEHNLEIRIVNSDKSKVYGKVYVTIPSMTADLKVNSVSVVREGSDALVSAVITNEGQVATNATAILTQEGIENKEIKEIGQIEPKENVSIKFSVKADRLIPKNLYDYKRFTVTVQSNEYEKMTGNNSGSALLEPISINRISIQGSKELSLNAGESYVCEYEILPVEAPKGTVIWMSDNTDVATVENGKIQAVKAGKANITALTTNFKGEQFKDTVTVTVVGDEKIGVSGIDIEPTKVQVSKNETVEVCAQILPENATNKKVKWTMDKENIVQLIPIDNKSSVNVKGLNEGTVVIVAETEDGGYTDSVIVEVGKEKPAMEYSINIQLSDYGKITCELPTAQKGDTINLIVTPNQGYTLNNITVLDEESNSLEVNKTEDGYSFTMPASSVKITADFIKKPGEDIIYHTLTFEVNGGNYIASISKEAGTVVSLNNYVPIKKGYVFEGWYLDSEFTKKITEVSLSQDTIVYAKWKRLSITDKNDDKPSNLQGSINKTDSSNSGTIKTGDSSQVLFWLCAGTISLVLMGVILATRKRKR